MPHINTGRGQFDHTVEVFIVCKNRVLLRKHDKYQHWLGVGGHIELNEDPNQAAIREVKEEVGLDILLHSPHALPTNNDDVELVPPVFLNRHPINDTHSHISYVFFARSTNDHVVPEQKSDQWQWLTKAEVEKNSLGMMSNIQYYALAALKELS